MRPRPLLQAHWPSAAVRLFFSESPTTLLFPTSVPARSSSGRFPGSQPGSAILLPAPPATRSSSIHSLPQALSTIATIRRWRHLVSISARAWPLNPRGTITTTTSIQTPVPRCHAISGATWSRFRSATRSKPLARGTTMSARLHSWLRYSLCKDQRLGC